MENVPLFVENLKKKGAGVNLFNDLSFAIDENSWSGIYIKEVEQIRLLIKILTGLTFPSSGRVYCWGNDIHRSFPSIKSNISYVGTSLDYIPFGSKIEEIINFHSSLFPRWEKSAEKKYFELLKLRRGIKIAQDDKYTISKLQILFAIAKLSRIIYLDGFHNDIDNDIREEFFLDAKKINSSIMIITNDTLLLERAQNRFGAILNGTLKFWDDLAFIRREHRIVRVFSENERDIKALGAEGILDVKESGKLKTLTISKNYNFTIEMLKMEGFLVLEEENYRISDLLMDRKIIR